MKMNKLMLAASVFSVGIATAASSYHVKIVDSTWVGQSELKPGEYDVTIDPAGKVTFKMGKTVVEAPAKIEASDVKYPETRMSTKIVNGQTQMKELDLRDQKSKVVFGDSAAVEAGTR